MIHQRQPTPALAEEARPRFGEEIDVPDPASPTADALRGVGRSPTQT